MRAKLGSGKRFASGVKKIEGKGVSKSGAQAIMAAAGIKKYGAKKMGQLAQAGKKRHK